jgi:hypothetical protein
MLLSGYPKGRIAHLGFRVGVNREKKMAHVGFRVLTPKHFGIRHSKVVKILSPMICLPFFLYQASFFTTKGYLRVVQI